MSLQCLSIKTLVFMFCLVYSIDNLANSNIEIPQFKFKSVTIDDGLANNRTTGATKDHRGFVWFATDDGLCQFDGLVLKNHDSFLGHTDDEFDQQFTSIYTDKSGNLLAGAYRLFMFNYDTERLEMVFDEDEKNQPHRIRSIIEDDNNTLWLGARNGIFFLDTNFQANQLPPEVNGIHYEIWDLIKPDNKIWIGTRTEGVVVFDLSDSTYTKVPLFNELDQPVKVILCLFNDNGTIWVGTKNNGIFKIDSETYEVISHEYPDKNVRRIRDIARGKNDELWLGTMEGLYLHTPGTKKYIRYAHKYHSLSNITHNSVFDVFIDNNEIMWLSTYAGGINYTDLDKKPIRLIKAKENDNNFLNNSIVSGFCVDRKNNVYVGTDHGGLNYWDRKTQKFTYYPHAPGSVSGTNTKCMVSDSSGNIWIGTYEGGISCFIPALNKFKYYYSNPKDSNSLQSNIVYSLAIDKDQNIWIGTNRGVDFLNTKTGKIYRKYSSENIHVIYIDEKNTIWMGIDGVDIFCYDTKKDLFKKCFNNIKIGSCKALFRDSEDNLWIGEKNGVSIINLETIQHFQYDKNKGLSSNLIFGIVEDDKKNIWLSSSSGLMKLMGAVTSPNNFEIKVYTVEDGLQSNQFWRNSVFKSDKGELFFGGVNGFNHFYPNEISENPFKPTLALTDLKILNKSVSINQEINGQIVLDKSINEKNELILNHKQKVFTLDFVAIHFTNPEKNKYKYMLYPFENEWNNTEYPRNSATYTSLPAGQYVFKLQGANSEGKWQSEILELKIQITPPIWKTWWFKLLLVVFITILIVSIFNRRVNRIRLQKINLEKLVEKRTKEIQDYTIQLEKQHSKILKQTSKLEDLNNLKDKLFSVIAHDLKNPFQSILGFSELLNINYQKYKDPQRIKYIGLIYDSSIKYYGLLENLLSWSRSQTGVMPFRPKKMDISGLFTQVIDLHQHKFSKKQISVLNKITNQISVFIDEQMISSVINNLLNNAIKFTETNGQIILTSEQKGNKIIISISDNGVGMTEEDKDNLFVIGKASSKTGTTGEQGTGLGLLICKDFIEKNKGKIWVESTLEKGSIFSFSLPTLKDS